MAKKRSRHAKSRKRSRQTQIQVFQDNRPSSAKMSEILIALLGPLADQLAEPETDLEVADALLSFAAVIWNISRFDEAAERRAWIRRYAEERVRAMAETEAGVTVAAVSGAVAFHTELVGMTRSLWPDDRRLVKKAWAYRDEAGELRVRAVSMENASDPVSRRSLSYTRT